LNKATIKPFWFTTVKFEQTPTPLKLINWLNDSKPIQSSTTKPRSIISRNDLKFIPEHSFPRGRNLGR